MKSAQSPAAAAPAPTDAPSRFALLQELMGQGLLVLDARGGVQEASGRAGALLGVPVEGLLGRAVWEAVPGLAGGPAQAALAGALASGAPARHTLRLPHGAWVELAAHPVGGGLWVLVTDVTVQHEAAERLEALDARYQVALDAGHMAVWETNLATGEVFRSDNHDRIYGYAERLPQWTHEMFLATLHPEDRAGVDAQVAGIFSGQVGDYVSTFRSRWPDGSWRWITSRARVLRDRDGRPTVVRGALLDITDLKQAEAALKDAVRTRDDFLSLASHELRTPLTALRLQVELLRALGSSGSQEALGSPRISGKLELVERQLRRLTALVDNLLDVSRIREGKLDFSFAEGDLAEVVAEVVLRFEPEARHAHARLTSQLASYVPARFDRLRVEQVLGNLLGNALRHAPGAPVHVSLTRVGRAGARITVSDGGPGVPPGQRERIFTRLEQGERGRGGGGLGLGLFIVRQVVEAHGGRVWVEGLPGKGATFVVELPDTHG
jgi:PAS domain S-box-containing protein